MCVSVGNGIYIVVPFVYVIMLQEFTCFHQDKGDGLGIRLVIGGIETH